MKKLITALFLFLFLLQFNTYAQWVNISAGLGNKQIYSLSSNSTNLFAGTFNYGLYKSSDDGLNWTQAGITLNNRVVFAMTIFGNYLYAGTDIGIWRSSNNGAYWSLSGINNNTIYSLASNQSRVFAGLHVSSLFYSSGGTSWFISSLNVNDIKSIAVNENFILAGAGNNAGVYLSNNNGNNWSSTSLNNKSVYSLALNGNYAYAGTGGGVYYSIDSGYTWTRSTLNNDLIYSLAVIGNNVYAGTEFNGVFLSTNNGLNWSQFNDGLPAGISVFALYTYNNYLYAGTSVNSIYRTTVSGLPATLDMNIFIQGFYNSVTDIMTGDTVIVNLRNSSPPYAFEDNAQSFVSSSGLGTFIFSDITNGVNYYLQVIHRNSIETWSSSGNAFSSEILTYDFTPAANNAYGSNQIQVDNFPVEFALFSGDVNQDGTIDLADGSLIDNDAFNFATGYIPTDVNGDGIIDLADAVFADNNGFNFVGKITP
ncbi:MAG: hypothetical protein WAT71_07190 [Ignavibacteria bacterium]